MVGLTINDILAKIDQRLDDVRLDDNSAPLISLDPLSEVGLYITNDRLLADLYRQYLEAQRGYVTSIQAHGKDSAMAETASYMSDSAFCAMETRLIELRGEKEMSERVAKVQAKQRAEYQQDMKQRQKTYARRGIEQPQSMNRIKKAAKPQKPAAQNTNRDMNFWAIFALSFLTQEQNMPYMDKPAVKDFAKAAA